jgi:hypothetical protein
MIFLFTLTKIKLFLNLNNNDDFATFVEQRGGTSFDRFIVFLIALFRYRKPSLFLFVLSVKKKKHNKSLSLGM